jgi:hypothetical protein
VIPFPGSRIGVPVLVSAFRIAATLADPFFDLINAHAPATCGAAIEVPDKFVNPPPGTDERILSPGAKSDRY